MQGKICHQIGFYLFKKCFPVFLVFWKENGENTSPLYLVIQVTACMFLEQGLASSQFFSTRISL